MGVKDIVRLVYEHFS
jgi:hypothetical protein